jgi:hypothetical protein
MATTFPARGSWVTAVVVVVVVDDEVVVVTVSVVFVDSTINV